MFAVNPATPPPVLVLIAKAARNYSLSNGQQAFRSVDPTAGHIDVTDLGVTRGDGIFEGIGIIDGTVQALEAHLSRLQISARMLDLPDLDIDVIRAAILHAAELHEPQPFLLSKVVVTRGIEGTGVPTAWVHTAAVPLIGFEEERRTGIRVVALDRGFRHDVALTSPWLLQGAKTLSYAVNKSVLREAARRGADDVLFISSDGYVLEGPSANLIARFGNTFVTPRTDLGILKGTTQGAAFEILEREGYITEYGLLKLEDLALAEGLWLASSGRQVAPISHIDGAEVAIDRPLTKFLADELISRRS